LSPYYHAADLLMLPSVWETWGLVVNDALHHGLPCIVSSGVDCHPDLIEAGRNGFVYDQRSDLGAVLECGLQLIDRVDVRVSCRSRAGGYSLLAAADGVERALVRVRTTPASA
jgi:glycosyltransferase involved in cell wall biosynthesis